MKRVILIMVVFGLGCSSKRVLESEKSSEFNYYITVVNRTGQPLENIDVFLNKKKISETLLLIDSVYYLDMNFNKEAFKHIEYIGLLIKDKKKQFIQIQDRRSNPIPSDRIREYDTLYIELMDLNGW